MAQTAAELIDLYTRALSPIGNAGQGRLAIEQMLAAQRQAEMVRAQQFAQQRALAQMQEQAVAQRQQQYLQEQYRLLGLRDTEQATRAEAQVAAERQRIAEINKRRSQNFLTLSDQSNALTDRVRQSLELTDAERNALAHQAAVEAQVENEGMVKSIKTDWRNLSQIKNAEKAALAAELFATKQDEAQKLKVGRPEVQALLRQQQAFDARVKLFAQNPELLDAVDFTQPQAGAAAPATGAATAPDLNALLSSLDQVADREAQTQTAAAAIPAYANPANAVPPELRAIFAQQDAAQAAQQRQQQLAGVSRRFNDTQAAMAQQDWQLAQVLEMARNPRPAPQSFVGGDPMLAGLGMVDVPGPDLRAAAVSAAQQRKQLSDQLAQLSAQRQVLSAQPLSPDGLVMQANLVPQPLQNPAVAQILQAIAAQTRNRAPLLAAPQQPDWATMFAPVR